MVFNYLEYELTLLFSMCERQVKVCSQFDSAFSTIISNTNCSNYLFGLPIIFASIPHTGVNGQKIVAKPQCIEEIQGLLCDKIGQGCGLKVVDHIWIKSA